MNVLPLFLCCIFASGCIAQNDIFIVAGYTDPKHPNGIHVYDLNFKTNSAKLLQAVSGLENPSFLALNASQTTLFGVSETKLGSVFAFDFKDNTLQNKLSIPLREEDPCHVSYYGDTKTLLVSNYTSGSFSKLIWSSDGFAAVQTIKLYGKGPDTLRQTSPHAHALYRSVWDRKKAYGADLGTDHIYTYELTEDLKPIDSISTDAGSGVRHLAFHPKNRWIYAANELNSTVAFYTVDLQGKLTKKAVLPTTQKKTLSFCAEIQMHPNGKKLYISNRGEDTIATFDINPQTGVPTLSATTATKGQWPRFFMITRDAKHLIVANQKSNNVVVFDLSKNGDIGQSTISFSVNAPVCIVEKAGKLAKQRRAARSLTTPRE